MSEDRREDANLRHPFLLESPVPPLIFIVFPETLE